MGKGTMYIRQPVSLSHLTIFMIVQDVKGQGYIQSGMTQPCKHTLGFLGCVLLCNKYHSPTNAFKSTFVNAPTYF